MQAAERWYIGTPKDAAEVYLETGKTRTFAGSVDWPGWCRGGRDKDSALAALLACGPRYARTLRGTRLGFHPPAEVSSLIVVEKLKGDATTDFGAPGMKLSVDKKPVGSAELRRFLAILKACWRAFDAAVEAASGKELRKGPRGGGRDLEAIIDHLLEADGAYLARVGWKVEDGEPGSAQNRLTRTRRAVSAGLDAAAQGRVTARGPRGGRRWSARYFVRRVAWHVLDHAWEIEDRLG